MLSRILIGKAWKAMHTSNVVKNSSRLFHVAIPRGSNYHPLASHRDTPDNNALTFFDFTAENYNRVGLNFIPFINSAPTKLLIVLSGFRLR